MKGPQDSQTTAGTKSRALVSLAMAVALALVLAACGGGAEDADGGSTDGGRQAPTPAAEGDGDDVTLAFVPGVAGDEYYGSLQCGIEAVAEERGATVETQAPREFSPGEQIPVLEGIIANDPDAILIAPTDSAALQDPLQRAVDAGITVVLVDTTLDDPSLAAAQVASDNIAAGNVAAETMAELLEESSGSVLTVNLSPGVTTTDDREAGFAESIEAVDSLTYLGQEFSNNSVQRAEEIVNAALAANDDLVGIFSTAAFNTEGAVSALRGAGAGEDVTVVGFNANPPGIDQIRDGTVAAQVVLKPYEIGVAGAEQAFNALDGNEVEPEITTGAVVATADNLEDPEVSRYLYSFDCPESES